MEKSSINVLDYVYLLVRRWKWIVANFLIVCVLAGVVSMLLPEWYASTAVILPPKEEKEQFGLTAILSEIPIPKLRLGEKGSPADIFIGLLKSRNVAERMVDQFDLMQTYEVERREDAIRMLGDLTEVGKTDEGMIFVTVLDRSPERCADMANAYVVLLDKMNQEIGARWEVDRKAFAEEQYTKAMKALEAAQDSLQEFQKRHHVISVENQAEVVIRAAAELETEIMGLQLQLQSLEASSLSEMHPEIGFVKKRIEIRENQLLSLSSGRGSFEERSQIFLPLDEIPQLQMKFLRYQMEMDVQAALVQFLRQRVEEKRMEAAKSIPTISSVDKALPPEIRDSPKRRLIVMISGLFSIVFMMFWILMTEHYHAIQEGGGANAEKLQKIMDALRWRKSGR
ncbi:MAG: Wzz/FepE/Etk N-terminal domain-containing protein [Candidatus Latescibacterota bacterium]